MTEWYEMTAVVNGERRDAIVAAIRSIDECSRRMNMDVCGLVLAIELCR